MNTDWSVIVTFMPQLLKGAQMTIFITVVGLCGGMVVGAIAGIMRAYGNWLLNYTAMVYIEVIRGTPIVVQVMSL